MDIILDNVIFSLQRAGGISVYWSELLRRLRRDGCPVRFVEHPRGASNIFRRQLDLDPNVILADRPLPPWLSRYLPYPVAKESRPLCHSSYYRMPLSANAIKIVTVYDFTYERFRHGPARWAHSRQKGSAIRAAQGIICISESTRRDLLERYPEVSPNRIRVIHLGAAEDYHPLGQEPRRSLLAAAASQAPFVLFVGGREPYKNFSLALEALATLPAYRLVSVGGGELSQADAELSQQLLGDRHTHLPSVDNQRLNLLYNSAHALLYPSSYEGFGIPIIEAMAAGCPVIAARVSAIPEAAGEAGLLVDAINAESFAQKVMELEDASTRTAAISAGLAQARRFSWETCYRQTMNFYHEVFSAEC